MISDALAARPVNMPNVEGKPPSEIKSKSSFLQDILSQADRVTQFKDQVLRQLQEIELKFPGIGQHATAEITRCSAQYQDETDLTLATVGPAEVKRSNDSMASSLQNIREGNHIESNDLTAQQRDEYNELLNNGLSFRFTQLKMDQPIDRMVAMTKLVQLDALEDLKATSEVVHQDVQAKKYFQNLLEFRHALLDNNVHTQWRDYPGNTGQELLCITL